jgi:hypothetical protein
MNRIRWQAKIAIAFVSVELVTPAFGDIQRAAPAIRR